ncbi:MAG: TIGR02679 family protein [Candidatus Polarisedimenticolaceae bacterium]|nr:TIGR02679 family protein [Candidatus Polarisedimenticolaceae bacterium]
MTYKVDPARLKSTFGKPELARLMDRLQTRFERGIDSPTLTLPNPELAERKAVASLLGRPPGSGNSIRIAIANLEEVIQRAGLAPDLRTAVESLRGPLRDLANERAATQQRWQMVFDAIAAEAKQRGIESWLDRLRKEGLLKRLAKGDPGKATTLLHQALTVIRQLPGQGQTLSTLAANTLGDAHALDSGRPVATLVKRALEQTALSESLNKEQEESERELWAGAGILVGGAITSTALVLNLPVSGSSFSDNIIHQAGQQGEPLWLTLRQLVRDPPQWQVEGCTIHICENPAVVAAAADSLGGSCAPLICTYGQPRAAVNHLLSQLQEAGAKLLYHGDFDWPGITIANGIMHRFDARPWHFDEMAYKVSLRENPLAHPVTATMELKGRPISAEWDPGLTQAMKEKKIAIPEERVLDILLKSLQEHSQ